MSELSPHPTDTPNDPFSGISLGRPNPFIYADWPYPEDPDPDLYADTPNPHPVLLDRNPAPLLPYTKKNIPGTPDF